MKIEASPFINTKLLIKVKEELYTLPFEYERIGNKEGKKPINNLGFLESDEAFYVRLKKWEVEEQKLIFEGWSCKDMQFFQELYNEEKKIFITFEVNEYQVRYAGKEFIIQSIPDTIDEFITDLKRLGIALYWKEELVDIYGIENIASNNKTIDYYGMVKAKLREIDGSSTKTGE